ncbi:MAG: NAD(P) transhydrogenase subunit alpha [Acetobacteraceae bacterium]
MNPGDIAKEADHLATGAQALALHAHALAAAHPLPAAVETPFVFLFATFVLAVFVGYYVVWNVTPALHSPLLSLTNAISSVIIVGAMLAAGFALTGVSAGFGFVAVVLSSVNIFGGFLVTQRMLQMFRKKK